MNIVIELTSKDKITLTFSDARKVYNELSNIFGEKKENLYPTYPMHPLDDSWKPYKTTPWTSEPPWKPLTVWYDSSKTKTIC